MSKKAKVLALAATVGLGASISTGAIGSNITPSQNKVENTKLLVKNTNSKVIKKTENDSATEKKLNLETTNNLANQSIISSTNVEAAPYDGIDGSLLSTIISFDTANMQIRAQAYSGGYDFDSGNWSNYEKVTLYNSNLVIQKSEQYQSQQSSRTIENFNGTPFEYNDIIAIGADDPSSYAHFGVANEVYATNQPQAWNSNIQFSNPISNGTTEYFKITPQGLVELNGTYETQNGDIYYFQNGQMLTNTWVNINEQGERVSSSVNGTTVNAYYLGANGIAEKGLQTIDGELQYFNPSTSQMELNKFIDLNGETYYLSPGNGVVATGWKTINGDTYHFNNNGIMDKGFTKFAGSTFYFNPTTGIAESGWQTIDGNKYYLSSSGGVNLGWVTIGSEKYYLNPTTGILETGWQTISGNRYYLNATTGEMSVGYQEIDGKLYNFGANGELTSLGKVTINGATNETINYGSAFNSMDGVTLTDAADPTAKINVSGTVDTNVPGIYKLTYTVTDEYGQTATVIREITVKPTYKVEINGVGNETISYGSTFNPMTGVTLSDPADPTAKISVSGTVNTKAPGTYKLTYTVKDEFGQTATATREITVKPSNVSIEGASNESIAYGSTFDAMAGVTLNDPENSTAKISVSGTVNTKVPGTYKLTYTVKDEFGQTAAATREITVKPSNVSIEGASNESIAYGSTFDAMAGVTLNDPEDPTAKISVSGTVNTKVSGTYKLTYTVTDEYGQTATATREIIVGANPLNSSTESVYWDGSNLVINGNVNKDGVLSGSEAKTIVIKDASGNTVDTINTVAVNWYSGNKDNYSGFQGVITANDLSKLKSGQVYSFYIDINGKEIPINSNSVNPSNSTYLLSTNSSNQLTIGLKSGEKTVNEGTGSYETGYFLNSGYVINGNVEIGNDIFSQGDSKTLLVKNSSGQVIDSINCASVNWYSGNSNNYSSFQAIIPNSVLEQLKGNDEYTLSMEVVKNGQVYEMPLTNNKNVALASNKNYYTATNSQEQLTIGLKSEQKIINEGIGSYETGYFLNSGYVINGNIEVGNNTFSQGDPKTLLIKNSEGQIIDSINCASINWYSGNSDNYSSFQAIIPNSVLAQLKGNNGYTLSVEVTQNGQIYEMPLTNNKKVELASNANYKVAANSQNQITITEA